MNSIFCEPSAHDVRAIGARVIRSQDFACLRLNLEGQGIGGAREGQFEIYGPADMADKFQTIAAAINAAFETVEVE